MGTSAPETEATPLSWKRRSIAAVLLLLHLCSSGAWGGTACQILRCNADFVAATLDLGGVGAGLREAARTSGYCGALRSYGTCTRRTARACRGDLAYHSAVQGIEDLLIQHRCPRPGPTAQPRPPPAPPPPATPTATPVPGEEEEEEEEACLYEKKGRHSLRGEGGRRAEPEYLHCGVFGDPHVRTFADDFQTCAAPGAWPLIDNDFLYVQATNTPTGGRTTALTKITIIFKSWRPCVDQQIYQAELDNVPAAFADGSVASSGGGGGGLAVRSQSPGRHAEIRAAHIGAVLVVRQSGRSLGLSVRAPRPVLEAFGPGQDVQLCVWGCPASQRIDVLSPPPASPSLSSSSSPSSSPASARARAHCGALLPARDVYYQACVFDLLASGGDGDLDDSSLAAVAALEDARAMIGDGRRLHLMPAAASSSSSPPPVVVGAGGPPTRHRPGLAAPALIAAVLMGALWSGAM